MDGAGGIDFADWIEAKDDDDAMAQARMLKANAHKCEIWLKDRLVARLNGEGRFDRLSA